MPPVCRFYLKGFCRYGQNCRFEHPGEGDTHEAQGGFSFTKALEEIGAPSSSSLSGFSFTKALQETNQQTLPGNFQPFSNTYNQANPSLPYYNHQTYQPTPAAASGFSFSRALTEVSSINQNITFGQSDLNLFGQQQQNTFFQGQTFNQPVHRDNFYQSLDEHNAQVRHDASQHNIDPNQSYQQNLTELELKAYKGGKFQFRLIPIRPPPEALCQ